MREAVRNVLQQFYYTRSFYKVDCFFFGFFMVTWFDILNEMANEIHRDHLLDLLRVDPQDECDAVKTKSILPV